MMLSFAESTKNSIDQPDVERFVKFSPIPALSLANINLQAEIWVSSLQSTGRCPAGGEPPVAVLSLTVYQAHHAYQTVNRLVRISASQNLLAFANFDGIRSASLSAFMFGLDELGRL